MSGKLVVGWGLAPTVLHHTTIFTAKLSGIFTKFRRFIAGVCGSNGVRDCVGITPAVLHHTTVFTAKLSGISTMVRRFIACVRQTLGRAGACSRRVTSHHRVIPPNYRGFSRSFAVLSHVCGKIGVGWGLAPTVLHRQIIVDFRDGSPFYRGCVRVERREQAPALHY